MVDSWFLGYDLFVHLGSLLRKISFQSDIHIHERAFKSAFSKVGGEGNWQVKLPCYWKKTQIHVFLVRGSTSDAFLLTGLKHDICPLPLSHWLRWFPMLSKKNLKGDNLVFQYHWQVSAKLLKWIQMSKSHAYLSNTSTRYYQTTSGKMQG